MNKYESDSAIYFTIDNPGVEQDLIRLYVEDETVSFTLYSITENLKISKGWTKSLWARLGSGEYKIQFEYMSDSAR